MKYLFLSNACRVMSSFQQKHIFRYLMYILNYEESLCMPTCHTKRKHCINIHTQKENMYRDS